MSERGCVSARVNVSRSASVSEYEPMGERVHFYTGGECELE